MVFYGVDTDLLKTVILLFLVQPCRKPDAQNTYVFVLQDQFFCIVSPIDDLTPFDDEVQKYTKKKVNKRYNAGPHRSHSVKYLRQTVVIKIYQIRCRSRKVALVYGVINNFIQNIKVNIFDITK